ncbi:hypothetical protein MMC28_007437 [Mycoblastus sanguinarius]|nr:hypothetical protein [Mycoblastus sanguinarius]
MPLFSSNKPKEKRDLWIVLYALGFSAHGPLEKESYHWALVTATTNEVESGQGTRFSVWQCLDVDPNGENASQYGKWIFDEGEEQSLSLGKYHTGQARGRFMIADIEDPTILRKALTAPERIVQGDLDWSCRLWVKDIYKSVVRPHPLDHGLSLVTAGRDWDWIEQKCKDVALAERHKAECYEGHEDQGVRHREFIPTWDLIVGPDGRRISWAGESKEGAKVALDHYSRGIR